MLIIVPQVDDSGRRILQEICGKVTGSCRKTPEIAGTWKQYSDRKLSEFFPVDSCQIPVLSGRNRPEIIRKNPKIFRPEYCFHKITGITRNRQFPDRVVRPGNTQCCYLHLWSTKLAFFYLSFFLSKTLAAMCFRKGVVKNNL